MVDWHCRSEEIQAYVDGELDGGRLQDCERHLRRCPACARLAARTLELSQSLGALDRQPPPVDLKERILEALARAGSVPALDCGEAAEALSAYLDDELSPQERERLETHLFTCPSCYHRYRRMQSLVDSLRVLPPAPAPAEMHSRILAALERRRPSRAVFTWRRAGQVVAGLAVAAAVALAVFVPGGPETVDGDAPPVIAALPDRTAEAGPADAATPQTAAPSEVAQAPGGATVTSPESEVAVRTPATGAAGRTFAAGADPADVDRGVEPAPATPPHRDEVDPEPSRPVTIPVGEPVVATAGPRHGVEAPATIALAHGPAGPREVTPPTPAISEPAVVPATPAPVTVAVTPPEPTVDRPSEPERVASSAGAIPLRSNYVRVHDGGSRRDPETDRRMAAAITARLRAGTWMGDDVGIEIR